MRRVESMVRGESVYSVPSRVARKQQTATSIFWSIFRADTTCSRKRMPLAERLSEIVGRSLDLVPEHELNRHLRSRVLEEAIDL